MHVAAAIDDVADALPLHGRRVRRVHLHLTLAFVGTIDRSAIVPMCRRAGRLHLPGFDLCLDRIGYFTRPKICWLGLSQPPVPLLQLAERVTQQACLQSSQRQFRPHVTLARHAAAPPANPEITPIHWPVRSFCLVESGSGGVPGRYRCLHQWSLA